MAIIELYTTVAVLLSVFISYTIGYLVEKSCEDRRVGFKPFVKSGESFLPRFFIGFPCLLAVVIPVMIAWFYSMCLSSDAVRLGNFESL